ncbi:hypothetical protein JCM9279_002111 [Rhodotorula babjevae]
MGAQQFDSATYLRGLGWAGPGSSLNNSAGGRAKPVTVVQKKTLSGVGRDRDTSFAWWDAVFTSVAKKVTGDKTEHHRTSTGILSHRPPPPDGNAYEPLTDMQKSGLNLDAMAAVKLELARRQLYSGFLRGTALSGSGGDDDKKDEKRGKEDAVASGAGEAAAGSSKKRKRDSASAAAGGDERAARKEEKRRKKDEDKAARKAAKAARKGKARADDDDDERASAPVAAVVVEETVEVATTSTPVVEPTPASLSKEDRRAAKKLRKQLEADSTSTSALASLAPSTASSSALPSASVTPAPADTPLDADEQAYLEAKAAVRRAEKEERRLARAAKKAGRA